MSIQCTNIKPVEQGNAQSIQEDRFTFPPVPLLRYEALANYYMEQPPRIRIQPSPHHASLLMDPVFRFKIRVPNQKISAWSLYSGTGKSTFAEKSWEKGFVIRHVVWEKKLDFERILELNQEQRGQLLQGWPAMRIENVYVPPDLTVSFQKSLRKLDKVLNKGIRLKNRKNPSVYRSYELMRQFDWGQIQTAWSPSKRNDFLESTLFDLCSQIECYLENIPEKVYQIDLHYSCPPDLWKTISTGDRM